MLQPTVPSKRPLLGKDVDFCLPEDEVFGGVYGHSEYGCASKLFSLKMGEWKTCPNH